MIKIEVTTAAQARALQAKLDLLDQAPIAFSPHHFALALDSKQVIVYNMTPAIYPAVGAILTRPSLNKFYGTHPAKLAQFARSINSPWVGCSHIGTHVSTHLKPADLSQLKSKLIEAGGLASESDMVAASVLIIQSALRKIAKIPLKSDPGLFNCDLSILTIYNHILTQYGPLTFTDLITKARTYPHLCRITRAQGQILSDFIQAGFLVSDPITALVSVPSN
jgi:hypothetical protein